MTVEGQAILVGVFGAAQGVKGEIRVKSFTADPAAIAAYGPLTARDGRRSFRLVAVRSLKDDMLVARVEGISTRSEAELLTNVELFIDRSHLPAPDDDEFYHADLIGLVAELTDGRVLGTIRAVENFGGGDLLDIAPPSGEAFLVPFTKAFVPTVNIASRRVVIAPGALGGDDSDDETAAG